jgi:hypothetical protein
MAANHGDGLLDQGAKVTVRNSVASQNGGNGFEVSAGGTLTLADSMATNNTSAGVSFNGAGTVFSYGDNEINGNGTDISGGTLTILRKR